MPAAVIDACCLIDLLASGHAEAVLRAAGFDWHLPVAVRREVTYIRQRDPEQPEQTVREAADLSPFIAHGLLRPCEPADDQELRRFTQYAALFRSDGEAMCLALAESRGWIVATDDRRAIRLAGEAGIAVISCPQILRTWAEVAQPAEAVLKAALKDIELLAQFRPNASMPYEQWWRTLSRPTAGKGSAGRAGDGLPSA